MIKIENVEIYGWEAAIRGMRNPMNSHDKSDSHLCPCAADCDRDCPMVMNDDEPAKGCDPEKYRFCIGENDFKLMQTLSAAGRDHGKFMRMIHVQCDVTAPLYWWKEADQYKVGTVTNSCSTMHKIHAKEFTLEDFSCEHLTIGQSMYVLKETVNTLNVFRDVYLNGGILRHENGNMRCFGKKDKEIWWQMIQLLPSSYNQKRTWDLNYAVLKNIYHARRNHKLDEWNHFCGWIGSLPYSELITT